MDDELISVIIPTFNRVHLISRAIDSVLAQSYKAFEIIIVDDASTDNTFELVNDRYGHLDNIQYVINDNNLGAGESRNVGVRYASGEYIAFLDSDDEWLETKLEKQYELLCKNKNAAMVYSYIERWEGDIKRDIWPPEGFEKKYLSGDIFPILLLQSMVCPPTMLIRKKVFEDLGGFRNIRILEDYDFSLRLALKNEVEFLTEVGTIQHISANGVNSDVELRVKTHISIIDQFYEWYDQELMNILLDSLSEGYSKIGAGALFIQEIENKNRDLYNRWMRK